MNNEVTLKYLGLTVALLIAVAMPIGILGEHAILGQDHLSSSHAPPSNHTSHELGSPVSGQWEGSKEEVAFSEFNHAFTGVGIIFVGLSELRTALSLTSLAWSRFLLPVGMLVAGIYTMIWSDHEAWPIGTLSLAETFSGNDPEMLQHKIFAVLLLGVGSIELFIRLGRIRQRVWSLPLPVFSIVGGLMLFIHMHGPHPAAQKIMMHHNIMGTLGIAAGSIWFASEFAQYRSSSLSVSGDRSVPKIIWAVLILLIGLQLVFYSES